MFKAKYGCGIVIVAVIVFAVVAGLFLVLAHNGDQYAIDAAFNQLSMY